MDKVLGEVKKTMESEEKREDVINHPYHYCKGEMECIDAIKSTLTKEAYRGFLKGAAMKYIWRHESKGNPSQDIEKAIWFLNKLKESLEEEQK